MAKRDKLTKKQKRQVALKQRQRLHSGKKKTQLGELSAPQQGLLVSRFGEQADVIDLIDKQRYRCYLRQNLGAPVTGDIVSFRLDQNQQGVVEAIRERTSVLKRPAQHQGIKPVVANISRVFVVTAPLPDFSATLLDRYLVALTDADIEVVILLNKCDLLDEIQAQNIKPQLSIYKKLGYPVLNLSAETGEGFDQLKQETLGQKSILVGQSGVGKSSIINQLFPEQTSLVNNISENSRLGQHTTTASQLFMFEEPSDVEHTDEFGFNQGFIIDSPGIREFGLWHMNRQTIAQGFIEFSPFLGSCKFRDCQHTKEPGCEIIKAVETGNIARQRWQNYVKIISSQDC